MRGNIYREGNFISVSKCAFSSELQDLKKSMYVLWGPVEGGGRESPKTLKQSLQCSFAGKLRTSTDGNEKRKL